MIKRYSLSFLQFFDTPLRRTLHSNHIYSIRTYAKRLKIIHLLDPPPNSIYSQTIVSNKTDTEGNSARLPFDFDSRIEMAIRACTNQLAEYQSAIGGRKRAKTGRRESNYPSHYYESGTVHSFRSPGGPEDDERIHLEGRGGKLI